jgi:hypothetical protein
MLLIRKIDSRPVTTKLGITKVRPFGLFICPSCTVEVEMLMDNGNRVETCGAIVCRTIAGTGHGDFGTPFYRAWASLKKRCSNIDDPRYGGRGITFDLAWENYVNFKLDMFAGWKPGLTIDRINVNGNYTKRNCQWITGSENSTKDKIKTLCKYSLDGVFIRMFESGKQAAKVEELSTNMLSRNARNGLPYKGFRWSYHETTEDLPSDLLHESIKNSDKQKGVVQLDKDTEALINTFESITAASKHLGIRNTSISNALSNRANTAGGYIWKYE